jgi:hypothetical protein
VWGPYFAVRGAGGEGICVIDMFWAPHSALYILLVGFGRACAPVRCAHPSFWAHKNAKRALRAPPIAASLLPQK